MSATNIFEQASRQAIRFSTDRGLLNIEDVWNLPLTSQTSSRLTLDSLAIGLHKQLKETSETSFVETKSSANAELQLKFDLVLHVINTKKDEAKARALANATLERRQVLLAALANKDQQALEAMTKEEIEAELVKLSAQA